jgi:hypothetical protein
MAWSGIAADQSAQCASNIRPPHPRVPNRSRTASAPRRFFRPTAEATEGHLCAPSVAFADEYDEIEYAALPVNLAGAVEPQCAVASKCKNIAR